MCDPCHMYNMTYTTYTMLCDLFVDISMVSSYQVPVAEKIECVCSKRNSPRADNIYKKSSLQTYQDKIINQRTMHNFLFLAKKYL